MTSAQLTAILNELESQFPGYYAADAWSAGIVIDTITSVNGSKYFDEAINTLYTYTTSWDAGVVLPIAQPGGPIVGDRWFDETNDLLFTYILTQDAGTAIPTVQPIAPFPVGTQWFDETVDTLYTAVTLDTWVGATAEVLPVAQPGVPVLGDKWFNETTDTLYEYINTWDAGVLTDTITSILDSMYFDETTNTLYTYSTSWNAGVVLATTQPSSPLANEQWFDEGVDTLYTYIDGGWLDLNEISHIILASDESIFPDPTIQINFDMGPELMVIRTGKFVGESFVETKLRNVIDFDLIFGIQLVNKVSKKAPYKYGAAV